jgi:hypothetical protein
MNFFIFRITDGFSAESLKVYSEIKVLPFYLPSSVFANVMSAFRQISGICAPIIRTVKVNGNIFKMFEQLLKISIRSTSVMPCQNDT